MPSSYGATTGTRLPQGPTSLRPPQQRRSKSSTSNKDMGLDAIRARRAKLEALTAQVRLPPLAPGDPKSKENVKPNNKSLTPPSDTQQSWAKPRTPTKLPSPTNGKRKPSAIPKLSQNTKPVQLYPMPTLNEPLPKIVRSDKITRTPPRTANSSPIPRSPTPPPREPTPPPRDPTPPPRDPTPPPREPTPPPREPSPVANKYQAEQKSRPNTTRKSSITSAGKRPATSSFNDNEYQEQLKNLVGKDLNQLLADLKQQEDKKLRHDTVTEIRRILSTTPPPTQALIQHGFVPPLIACLKEDNNPEIQFEACWGVTNICSGSTLDAQSIVEGGGIPVLRDILLSSSSGECVEQAVWALGNILGDYTHRDHAFKEGVVPPLINLTKKQDKDGDKTLIRNLAWSISNIFRNRGMKSLSDSDAKICMPIFERLIHHDDTEVKSDTMWSLSYIADGDESDIQAVIDTGVVPDVVQYIHSDDPKLQKVALRTIGNIITGTDEQTDYVLNSGVLPSLKRLLRSHQELDPTLVKEMIWVISNVCAGTSKQIELVIHFHLVPIILELMQKAVPSIKKEACWAMLNITESSDVKQVKAVVMLGAVKQLCAALHPDTNESTSALCLKSLKNIKEKCDVLDNIPQKIVEAKGKENLEFWATNQNQSELAKQLLDYIDNNGDENKTKKENDDSSKEDVNNFFAEKDKMENNKGSHENSLTDIKDAAESQRTNERRDSKSDEERISVDNFNYNLFE